MHKYIHVSIHIQKAIFLVLLLLLSVSSVFIINDFYSPFTTAPHTTVPRLVPAWSYISDGSKITSPPVAFKGMIYLVSFNMLDALDASSGIKRWSFTSSNGELSSPMVVNGIVYTYSTSPRGRTGSVYALDAASGVEKWHFTTNVSSCGLPPIVSGVVYAADNNGILYALDAISGAVRWSYATGGAFCTSLTVANGAVYIAIEYSSGDRRLDALNASSGINLWSYPLTTYLTTSPIVADGMIYIVLAYDQDNLMILDALSARTGTRQWSFTAKGALIKPVVMSEVVYIGSSEPDPLNGNGTLSLDALSATSGNKLWSYHVRAHTSQSSGFSSMFSYGTLTPLAVMNGVVYADLSDLPPKSDETLYALDALSGNRLWSSHLGIQDPISSSLVVANGMIYAGTTTRGKLYTLNAQSGRQLLSYLITDSPQFAPVVVDNRAYFTATTILYAFTITLKEASPSPSSLKTTIFSPAHLLSPAPVPVANNAPVFADVPGLHVQSPDGVQCSDHLVLASDRLTYNENELQQMRNYLHQLASQENASMITPPSTLRWAPGSEACYLALQISNTGDTAIQIRSVGVQLTTTPRSNTAQRLRSFNFCSVASQEDAGSFCGGRGSGGGGCSLLSVNIALKADAAPTSSFIATLGGGNDFCFEPTLHPNDTIDVDMYLTSPGKTSGSIAADTYSVMPVITTIDSQGSHTFPLTSMTNNATFLSNQQFSCYRLLRDSTFVLDKTFSGPCQGE